MLSRALLHRRHIDLWHLRRFAFEDDSSFH
jgi:hypothetical protein